MELSRVPGQEGRSLKRCLHRSRASASPTVSSLRVWNLISTPSPLHITFLHPLSNPIWRWWSYACQKFKNALKLGQPFLGSFVIMGKVSYHSNDFSRGLGIAEANKVFHHLTNVLLKGKSVKLDAKSSPLFLENIWCTLILARDLP